MKNYLLLAMLISMAPTTYAQCPTNATDDVRVVYLDFEFTNSGFNVNPCKQHSLHNEVLFVPKFRPEYNNDNWSDNSFWCDPADGTSKFQLFDG